MSGSKNFLSYQAVEPFNLGALGVKIFFVISAFLITTLLLKELAKTGSVSLRKFYIRRAWRILPSLLTFVAVVFSFAAAGIFVLTKSDLAHFATFTVNYSDHRSWWIAHLWSISIEEQFYFLWPVILYFLGQRKAMQLAMASVVLIPVIRLILWAKFPSYRGLIGFSFETCADSFATGCLLAGFRDWLGSRPVYLRFLKSWLFLLVPTGMLFGSMTYIHPRMEALFGVTLENVCIALLIDRAIRFPFGRLGAVLNSRPFVFVGVLSYSIYLWQQLFCRRVEFQNLTTTFPMNLILLSLCALTSYYLVEQPALRLKSKREAASIT